MAFQLHKFEDNVLYVASTPGNSFDGIEEFFRALDLKLTTDDARGSVSVLWDGREGTYNGPMDELIDIADKAAELLPALDRAAVVVANDQTKGVVEALTSFAGSRGIEMLVTTSFKTANHWLLADH
jgi:hypothetical protein